MKKIILLMLMLSPFANADMDKICSIVLYKDDMTNWQTKLEEEVKQRDCIRNNIFEFAILEIKLSSSGISLFFKISSRK